MPTSRSPGANGGDGRPSPPAPQGSSPAGRLEVTPDISPASLLTAKLQEELAQNFHFVTIPLMILATVAIGFMLVYLKEVLVPFVIGVFLVYLLKPWVTMISRPCSGFRWIQKCIQARTTAAGSYTSLPTTKMAYSEVAQYKRDDIRPKSAATGKQASTPSAKRKLSVGIDPSLVELGRSRSASPAVSTGTSSLAPLKALALHATEHKNPDFLHGSADSVTGVESDDPCRCPYWLAVLVTLACFGGAVSAMFLLVLGSIESFKEDGLDLYLQQAVFVSNYTLSWLYDGFGIEVHKFTCSPLLFCLKSCQF